MQQGGKTSQIFCHENATAEVSVSIVSADILTKPIIASNTDKHNTVGVSQHSSGINNTSKSHVDFRYGNIGKHLNCTNSFGLNIHNNLDSTRPRLIMVPDRVEHLNSLWQFSEQVMDVKFAETCKVLEVYGIGDGELVNETEEGQLWRMIQGNASFTRNLI